jgi:hypothetical protein
MHSTIPFTAGAFVTGTDQDEEDWGDAGDTTLGGYLSAGF